MKKNVHLVDLDTGELEVQHLELNRTRPRNWRERVHTDLGNEPSKTKQAFKDEVDINRIMDRYQATGQLPPTRGPGRFGDFTGAQDYLEAATRVLEAQRAFEDLPSEIRDYCENDPAELLDIVLNPERLDEAQELGLVEKTDETASSSSPGPVDDKRIGVQDSKVEGKTHGRQTTETQPRRVAPAVPQGGSGPQEEPA